MKRQLIVGTGFLALGCLLLQDPEANAQPVPVPVPVPVPGGGIIGNAVQGGPGGSGGLATGAGAPGAISGPNISPGASAALFLCPGVGVAVSVLFGGGGYCDYNFVPIEVQPGIFGNMHSHCEWGGAPPVAEAWNCWRVFPGQPDHPRLTDPDIIPDGWGVPWAIIGPTPTDQGPPIGLAPGQELLQPPPEPQP